MNLTAYFRCDASINIGAGHVMRCLTLADWLSKNGFECHFITDKNSTNIVSHLQKYTLHSPDFAPNAADILIVDGYDFDKNFETPAKNWTKKIMVIDDMANRTHDCDILLDQNYGRKDTDYKNLVPNDCQILTGVSYALLRPQFLNNRPNALNRRNGQIDRILISMGGTNVGNITETILKSLNDYKGKKFHIDVVLGQGAQGFHDVQKLCAASEYHSTSFHSNVSDMSLLMLEADLAIGAAGSTIWERCCMGLPQILISLADNQMPTLNALSQDNIIFNLGHIHDFNKSQLFNFLDECINNQMLTLNYAQKSSQLCDGLGVERVGKTIKDIIA